MQLGIIGLPNSSKTTVFNALTRGNLPTTTGTTGKLEIHTVIVDVPDVRVEQLCAIFKPRKTTYAKVTYADIAGLDKGVGKKGLEGELRNRIAQMDALVHVLRAFADERIVHPLGSIDPQRDLEVLDQELLLADLATVENRLARIAEGLQRRGAKPAERQALQAEDELFRKLHAALEADRLLRDIDLTPEEIAALRNFGLLTLKPTLVVVNTGDELLPAATLIEYEHQHTAMFSIQGKLEMDIAQLPPDDAAVFMAEFELEEMALSRIIQSSYDLVGLQSFFTVGEDEVRAWTIRKNATAIDAAGTIHSDLARGFIRAEVTAYTELLAAGNLANARKAGKLRLEGKDYIVQDGDIVHIRFAT